MSNIDFLIVGGGLAGTMLAFEMIDQDLEFRIMSSPLKSKASSVAAGMFNPLVFKRMTKSWMADDLIPVMKSRYKELEQKLQLKFYNEIDILKPLSEQEIILWQERKSDAKFARFIRSVHNGVSYNGVKNSKGFGIVTQSGYINMAEFLDASYRFFANKGLIIEGDYTFENLESPGSIYKTEEYNFKKVIFCEGYHMIKNPFFSFIPLRPVKGEILEIYSPKLPQDYMINRRVFVLPIGNHRFKVGSTYDWKDSSEATTENGKLSILARLSELITTDFEIENHRAGIRPTVSDRRPVLGRHPNQSNLYIFNGLGTKGVMLAPYFASEMVKYITHSKYILPNEADIRRFQQA